MLVPPLIVGDRELQDAVDRVAALLVSEGCS